MSCAIPPEWKKRFVTDLALRKEGTAAPDIQTAHAWKAFAAGILVGATGMWAGCAMYFQW